MLEKQFQSTIKINRAIKRYEYEFFHLVGRKGVGKTTLAVKIMCQVYMELGYDEGSAWQMAIDNTLFDKNDIINFLKKHRGKPAPVLCWDDARVFGSGMSYVSQPLQTQTLLGLLDTIRTSTSALILTSPSITGLLKFLRNEEGWLIKITKGRDYNWRSAKAYQRYLLPSGAPRLVSRYYEDFHYRLPDWVFEKIEKKRIKYKDRIIKFLDERIKQTDGQRYKKWRTEINEQG